MLGNSWLYLSLPCLRWGCISVLISALGRSHCPCTAIRWGRTSRCCLQRGRTGSSALWLCRSHCRGIGSQKGRRFHCSRLHETSGSPEQEMPRVRGLPRRPKQIDAHWLDGATSPKANPPKPTAAQSISGNEATENESQKYGEGESPIHQFLDALTQSWTISRFYLKSPYTLHNTPIGRCRTALD